MNAVVILMGYWLVAQGHDRYDLMFENRPGAEQSVTDEEGSLTPLGHTRDDYDRPGKLQPPQLLAEALEKPAEGAIVGKPLSLTAALAKANDRKQMLRIVQAYWKLSTAEAGYHWALDARERLTHYTRPHTREPEVQSARATARADVLDAELAVIQAQQELAELVNSPSERQLPVAEDRPHVGEYVTGYEENFANRAAPPRLRLLNTVLPLRRKSIDLHGAAVVASLDALTSIGDDYANSPESLPVLLTAMSQLRRERRAFLTSVRDYNQEIAEYLFAFAPANMSQRDLASRLILNSERAQTPDRNRPATHNEPIGGELGLVPVTPPPSQTFDSPVESPFQRPTEESTAPPFGRRDDEPREQDLEWESRYPPIDDAQEELGSYHGMLQLQSAQLTQKLGDLLHWDRVLPADIGRAASLAECLRAVQPDNRPAVIAAYWRAREHAARYQAAQQAVEQFGNLYSFVTGRRMQPGMTEVAVRLQAFRKSVQAAQVDSQAALLLAEYDLTMLVGRRADGSLILPATSPQSGGYELGEQSSRRAPQRAAVVRLEYHRLQQRADAVVRLDDERATLANQIRSTRQVSTRNEANPAFLVDHLLWAIDRQYDETLTFLHDLTGYNLAIARYALAIVPPGISADDLVKYLVAARGVQS